MLAKDQAALATVGDVTLWDLRRRERQGGLVLDTKKKVEVSCISASPADSRVLAVGYSDGSIRLWDVGTRQADVTFTGHRTSVTCLAWDAAGLRLVSGSKDSSVIVWDVVAECGLARLQGHKVGGRQEICPLSCLSCRVLSQASSSWPHRLTSSSAAAKIPS